MLPRPSALCTLLPQNFRRLSLAGTHLVRLPVHRSVSQEGVAVFGAPSVIVNSPQTQSYIGTLNRLPIVSMVLPSPHPCRSPSHAIPVRYCTSPSATRTVPRAHHLHHHYSAYEAQPEYSMLRCRLTASEHKCPPAAQWIWRQHATTFPLLSQHSRLLAYIWQFVRRPSRHLTSSRCLLNHPSNKNRGIGATCKAQLHHPHHLLPFNVQATHIDMT